jgi:hypothetical protein
MLAIAVVAAIGAPAEFHRIPARPVRNMLAMQAQSQRIAASPTAIADPIQLPPKLAVRSVTIGVSRPLVMLPGPPDPTAALILEPMTNGCMLVIITNAAPDYTWTLQTSTNLTCCWTDGQSFSNATSYVVTNCFADGIDQMFLRLLDP